MRGERSIGKYAATIIGAVALGAAPAVASAATLTFSGTPHIGTVRMYQSGAPAGTVTRTIPGADEPGCGHGWSWVDHFNVYATGLRVGVADNTTVFDLATTRVGDRSPQGFVIGAATYRRVRALLKDEEVSPLTPMPRRIRLGTALLSRTRVVGPEESMIYYYWFTKGTLSGLQVTPSGC